MDRRSLLRVVPAAVVAVGASSAGALLLDISAASAGPQVVGTLSVPKLGLTKTIYAGIGNDALDIGVGHGPWSPFPGTTGHAMVFGHRTSKGGPFRKLHKLRVGDAIVTGGVTYRVRKIEVVSISDKPRIWRYDGSGRRLSLVACSKPNGAPTSLSYRICVRASA